MYADIDRALLEASREHDTITAVTRLAVTVVPGVEQASISEVYHGTFRTIASSGPAAAAADAIQYELGSGPGVDAITADTVFRSGNIALDTRWPLFGPRAHTETGTTSMLALRLSIEDDDRIAGLTLYSTQPDAFDDHAQIIATVLATHCAMALTAAAAQERAANLHHAVTSNRQIGMAMGILMNSHKIRADGAFARLRTASQNSNRKLLAVAEDVIHTGTLPTVTPVGAPHRVTPRPHHRSTPAHPVPSATAAD